MIEISQKEFESKIEDLISGKISRIKLAKVLETDIRTLNNKIIQEISTNNPDLYIRYIEKYPYKQKKRDDIDFEALVIEMIKERIFTIDAASEYKVGVRTIQRRVNQLEKENPYLINIYKQVKSSNKNNTALPIEVEEQIAKLVRRPVIITEKNSTRKTQLEEIERVFNNRCNFVSKQEAAESMGTSMNRIYKLLNELYRIRVQENYSNMDESFKNSLKVEVLEDVQTSEGKLDKQIQRSKERGE